MKRPRGEEEDDEPPSDRLRVQTAAETATQSATQTDLDLSRSFEHVNLADDEPYFDLTPYTFDPFVLTKEDARRLQSNLPLVSEKEHSVPMWQTTDDISFSHGEQTFRYESILAKGRHGFVMKGTFNEKPCIAKILYLNMLGELHSIIQEVLIHAILLEVTGNNEKLTKTCTKIPRLEAFGRTATFLRSRELSPHRFEIVRESTRIPSAIIIMEEINHDLLSYVRQRHITPDDRSSICAAVFHQVATLLSFLSPYNFMHADLKMNNVTFNLPRRSRKLFPITYIIDFGMSSLDYKGFRIGAGMIFRTVRFDHFVDKQRQPFHNPYTDLTYLAWSMWHFHNCDNEVIVDCSAFTPVFSKILQRILRASGIPFETDRSYDAISVKTFNAMIHAGLESQTNKSPYFRESALYPEQIKHYAALYMQSVGSKRHGKEARNKLLRILESH